MTPEREAAWFRILNLFAVLWPFIQPTTATAEAWELALSELTDEELAAGAHRVAGTLSRQPTPSDIREAVQGKLTWVDVWQRDPWGSLVLKHGARVSVGRIQVRVREGEEPPILLSWGTVDDEHWRGARPVKHEPLLLPDSVVGKLSEKTRPQ